MVNNYTIYDQIGRASNAMTGLFDCSTIEVFSRVLTMSEVDFWCIHASGKQTRKMDTALRWLNTVLAVCEYMSFAKSWQEKGCSSHAETCEKYTSEKYTDKRF